MATIKIKRIYEPIDKNDGIRILVDRLWPRGVKKVSANIDEWLKNVGPSTELREWFHHDPSKWEEFRAKYMVELKQNTAVKELLDIVKNNEIVTLIYASHDTLHNQALVLQQFLS
jgi:uncharacterized protein YeaO (DUF488 family)